MKNDIRTRYTKNIIRTVFLELLKERPVNKITVKEICDRAEINRGTFYKHYLDVYDLMEHLEAEALEKMETLIASLETDGSRQMLLKILETLREHQELINVLSKNMTDKHFLVQMSTCCMKYVAPYLTSGRANDPETDTYTYSYVIGGASAIIEQWFLTNMKETPEQLAEIILTLTEPISNLKNRVGGSD